MNNNTECINEKGGKVNGQANEGSQWKARTKPNEQRHRKYFFKDRFLNEFDAFVKYFKAISTNGVMLNIINGIENMGDYCDLFRDVNKDFYKEPINLYHDSIPEEEQNEKLLYASNLIEIIDSREKGRCLISNAVIPKNKVLIYEPPTVLQINPLCTCVGNRETSLYRCHNCGIACKMFFTCDGCNVCIFCSRTCMLHAYANYHRYECYGLQRHFWSIKDTDYSYLSLRMMLYGASKDFKSDPIVGQPYGDPDNNYPFIYMLESHFRELSLAKVNEILYSSARNLIYLITKTTFFNQFKDRKLNLQDLYVYIGGLMVRHHCQAQINNVILKYPNVQAGLGVNLVSGSGKAICPTLALLNHSCTPNAVIIMYYDSVAIKTIKPIRPGEEITVCYWEIDALLTLSERQIICEEILFFTCNCYFCEYERTWGEAPYKCQLCNIGRVKRIDTEDDKVMGFCLKCQKSFDFNAIYDTLKVASICQNLYKATYAIEHVTRLAECYSNLFPPNSWKLLDVYKLLYEKHVLGEEKPLEAIKYGLLSFNILEHYVSRLYLPLLIAKVVFVTGVLNMRNFVTIKIVTESEFDVMKVFVTEIMKMKEDLEFYLPEKRIVYFQEVMVKVHATFKMMQLN